MKKIYSKVSLIILAIIVFFVGRDIYESIGKLSDVNFSIEISYGYLAAFFIAMTSSVLALGYCWILVLKRIGGEVRVSYVSLWKVFLLSWLARYEPTKLLLITTRITKLDKFGLPKKFVILSSIIDFIFQFMALGFVSLLFVLLKLDEYFFQVPWYLFVWSCVLLGIFALAILLRDIRNLVFSFVKKIITSIETVVLKRLSISFCFSIFLGYLVGMMLWGLSFFFLVNSFFELPIRFIFEIIGLANVASLLGFFILFLPAGLGVREGVLFFLLQPYVPIFAAIAAPIFFRLGSIIVDTSLFLVFYILEKSIVSHQAK